MKREKKTKKKERNRKISTFTYCDGTDVNFCFRQTGAALGGTSVGGRTGNGAEWEESGWNVATPSAYVMGWYEGTNETAPLAQ